MLDNTLYRKLVGSLLYLTHFRPDLTYALGYAERYMKEPHGIHWKAAKRILHYVQRTKHFEIQYDATSPLELVGFTNSDCDGDSTDMNSNSGYVIMFAHGPIHSSSKKQHNVSLSSAHTEYRAINATTQFLWLQGILRELIFYYLVYKIVSILLLIWLYIYMSIIVFIFYFFSYKNTCYKFFLFFTFYYYYFY